LKGVAYYENLKKIKNMRKFAISDIHGCAKTFKALVAKINLSKTDELYILGDYIDRGPDSKGVIDYIWQLQEEGFQVKCSLGNHEEMLLENIRKADPFYKGYPEVLKSFGVNHIKDIPVKYTEWMKYLPFYFEVDEYILVHAGLNFKSKNPLQELQDMIWIRNWYDDVNHDWLGERIIIHGHTPMTFIDILNAHADLKKMQVIDIDNGCCFEREGLGSLCCFEMTERNIHFKERIDF